VIHKGALIPCLLRLQLICMFERFHHAFNIHAFCNACNTKAQKRRGSN
jgi:hypothetical protein